MKFFSSALDFIRNRRNVEVTETISDGENSTELDFSTKNYVKESFSVLIVEPLSKYTLKILRSISFVISGTLIGVACAALFFITIMQFGALENTILSSLIISKIEKAMPDSDLSIKSANLHWNRQKNTFEIELKRVRLDDFRVPSIVIVPNYTKSFTSQKLVIDDISIVNPKISIGLSDDWETVYLNPNLEKGGNDKMQLEPVSQFKDAIKNILDKNSLVKLVNAAVIISENGVDWHLKNLSCEQTVGEQYPRSINFSMNFPLQNYTSNFGISLTGPVAKNSEKLSYNVKIESINPAILNKCVAERNAPLPHEIFSVLEGYNIPVSGNIKLNLASGKLVDGSFDFVGSGGSVRLPNKNIFSLNFGRKIDAGSISGTFSRDNLKIDSVNLQYGNTGMRLTGVSIPLYDYSALDVANIDGTLRFSNVNINEINTLFPESITKSVRTTFERYLPNFKLESFKVDLKGPIALDNRALDQELSVLHGVFKISDAQIPLGKHNVSNINAVGVIANDGLDVKLSSAQFGNTKINSGTFFLSNRDDSWIGKINADVAIDDITGYASDISPKLASMPINQLNLKGIANLDLSLVRVEGDKGLSQNLPFRIVEGNGVLRSENNTSELSLAWNSDKLSVKGHVNSGKEKIDILLNENLVNKSGNSSFTFYSHSNFLETMLPLITKYAAGNYVLNLTNHWTGGREQLSLNMDLRDALLNLPVLGNFKNKRDKGNFTMHISKNAGKVENCDLDIKSESNSVKGNVEFDQNGNLSKLILDEVNTPPCVAKINFMRKENNKFAFSAIGDVFDVTKVSELVNMLEPTINIDAYINFKNIRLFDSHEVRNVKGNLNIANRKIVGGDCYAVFGEDSTLALTAKDIPNSNDYVLSFSASDAGEFCKYLKLSNTIKGGNMNVVVKSSKTSDKSLSGVFEMKDFIVRNNPKLNKLLSLSTTNLLQDSESVSVGFNSCMFNFTLADNQLIVESGRAVSPTVSISFHGNYDRLSDDLNLSGYSVPMATVLNGQNADGALASNYVLKGQWNDNMLSVKPLKMVRNEVLRRLFGNLLPIQTESYVTTEITVPLSQPDSPAVAKDPFANGAFDKKPQTIQKKATTRIVNGVRVTRGHR